MKSIPLSPDRAKGDILRFVELCFDQRLTQIVVLILHAGQREEEAAANRANVLFQRLAIKAFLYREEAFLQVVLEADKQQPHLQLS